MKIYNYNKETKEFTKATEAKPSPLETNIYLVPANATKTEPLANKVGFAVCFNEEKKVWEYIEDNRGKTVYSTDTKASQKVDYIGRIKDGFTLLVPGEFDKWTGAAWETDVDSIKTSKLSFINTSCEAAIVGGFTSSALGSVHVYQSDRDDQINLMGLVTAGVDDLLKCGVVTTVTEEDGTETETITWDWKQHTAAQLKAVFDDGALFKKQQLIKANTLKAQVAAATTAEELNRIVW